MAAPERRGQAAVQRVPAAGAHPARQARGDRPVGVAVAARRDGPDRIPRPSRGGALTMRVRVIHFVPDVAEAARFYEALGLRSEVHARTGTWIELIAAGGELDLHDAASAADGEGREGFAVNFVADEPLEVVERRLRDAGFPPDGDDRRPGVGTVALRARSRRDGCPDRRAGPRAVHVRGARASDPKEDDMATVSVRYIVDDVDAAIAFYTRAPRLRRGDASGPDVRDALSRRPAPRAERTERRWRRWAGDARRYATRARRLEPLLARGVRPCRHGRDVAQRRRSLSE